MDIVTLAMAKAYSDSKGGYIEPAKIIFSEQLESGNLQTEKNIDIVAGEKYTIFLTDGKEKYILATSVVAKVTDGIAWLGNLSLIFGDEVENTGESYVVISTPTQESIIITGTSSNSTLAIEMEETIHPIDPKFLPGVCLPVVELSTEPTTDGARLTDEETAAVRAAWENGLPAVIAFAFNGTLLSGVFSFMSGVYTMTTFGLTFAIEDVDGGNLSFAAS